MRKPGRTLLGGAGQEGDKALLESTPPRTLAPYPT